MAFVQKKEGLLAGGGLRRKGEKSRATVKELKDGDTKLASKLHGKVQIMWHKRPRVAYEQLGSKAESYFPLIVP